MGSWRSGLQQPTGPARPGGAELDVILLVRGGGSTEDLWAFNDESLARVIARCPVPIVCGIGHETVFTIADFVADLRAPTPTAAAELVAQSRDQWLGALDGIQVRLHAALSRRLDTDAQRIDNAAARLGRPSALAMAQRVALLSCAQRLGLAARSVVKQNSQSLRLLRQNMPAQLQLGLERSHQRLARAALRLDLLDPSLVLQRGYAWLANGEGRAITSPKQTHAGQLLHATVAGGTMDLLVPARV